MKKINSAKYIFFIVSILGLVAIYFSPNLKNKILYGLSSFGFSFFSGRQDNLSLNEELNIARANLIVLGEENKRLERELGVVNPERKQLPVKLLSEKSRVYENAYIDISNANVSVGDFVYAKGGVLAGQIEAVENSVGRLVFLGSQDKFIAEILNTGELIELSGSGIGYYKGNIPKTSSLGTGDLIVMKGFPKAIVGNISSIEESDTSVTTIWVRSPINLLKTEIFYVDQK